MTKVGEECSTKRLVLFEQHSDMNVIAGLITVLIPLLFGTVNALTPVSDIMVGRNRDFSYAVDLFSRTENDHG